MPEHDTFDLDAAFAAMEQDLAGVTSPRGAGAAIATARRRRRTTIGAVMAVAVLAVAGAAVGQGLSGRDQSVGPAGSLPDPAPLTAQAMSGATAGWMSNWSTQDGARGKLPSGPLGRCFDLTTTAHAVGDETRTSDDLVFTSNGTAATAILIGFGTGEESDAIWNDVRSTFASCSGSAPGAHLAWDGASAESFDVASGAGQHGHLWIAREGSAIGLLWVSAEPSDLTTSADDGVARALVAALEFPGSMKAVSDSSSSTSSSSSSSVVISSADFGEALGDWQSGWSATGGKGDAGNPPCSAQIPGARFGSGSSLGSNGDQETYGFVDADGARSAVQSFVSALTACASASYAVSTAPTPDGLDVTVAVGSGQDADVIWLLRVDSRVSYVAVPAGDSAPPSSVSSAVGDLMVVPLKVNAPGSDGSTPGGPVVKKATSSGTKLR